MFPVIQILGLSVPSSGLIILAGVWLALTLAEKYSGKLGSDPAIISNLTFYALIAALLGARLSYALRFPDAFIDHPASLVSLNPGLLDLNGAALAAIITAFIYGQRQNLSLAKTLDALTPGFGVMLIAISISQMGSGLAFGLPTELPWAIELWGASRHPSQIYSAILASFILYITIFSLIPHKRWNGQLFLSFLSLASFSRIFLDAFRDDSIPVLFGLRTSQIIAWLLLASALLLFAGPKKFLSKKG